MMFAKLLTGLMATGLIASAVPASAHAPKPRVGVHLDLGHVHVDIGRPAPVRHPVVHVDQRLLDKGIRLERKGQRLIEQGQRMQWRGQHRHKWRLVRRGQAKEARGHDLVRQGRAMQRAAYERRVGYYY